MVDILGEAAMRTSIRARILSFAALASLTLIPACVGGLPYRRPGSDLVTREGPSNGSWLARTIACSVLADSARKAGARGSANDCERARTDTATMRDPNNLPGHRTP
jgi:hypothetical protein